MIFIDGSHGEGGGQILRSSLALSMITGRSIEIGNIRAKRKRPGLCPQHLTCVKAAASVCTADLKGAQLGSQHLIFAPNKVRPGCYTFGTGTAGSVMLVLQTILMPLALSSGCSEVTLSGGTHVPWSPCFHYIDLVFRPVLSAMGISFDMKLERWGFYPRGGGIVKAKIHPATDLNPFCPVVRKTEKVQVKAISASAHLPEHIRKRQSARTKSALKDKKIELEIEEIEASSACPGSLLFLRISGQGKYAGFTGLGARGKPAEKVSEEAVFELISFLDSDAGCDKYLSDQILLPAQLACGESHWTTTSVSNHFLTNAWVIERFGLGKVKFFKQDKKITLNVEPGT